MHMEYTSLSLWEYTQQYIKCKMSDWQMSILHNQDHR